MIRHKHNTLSQTQGNTGEHRGTQAGLQLSEQRQDFLVPQFWSGQTISDKDNPIIFPVQSSVSRYEGQSHYSAASNIKCFDGLKIRPDNTKYVYQKVNVNIYQLCQTFCFCKTQTDKILQGGKIYIPSPEEGRYET